MFHNTLYRLERSQKQCLAALGVMFLGASFVWFLSELKGWELPLEPVVVFIGGLATLLANYWPWKPTYADKRLKGRVKFDYETNSKKFVIGRLEMAFTVKFSKCSDKAIYIYRDPPDIEAIALVYEAGKMSDVQDVTDLDYASRSLVVPEGGIVALKNIHGCYALLQIHDVLDADRSDDRDEVTFSYMINPVAGTSFR